MAALEISTEHMIPMLAAHKAATLAASEGPQRAWHFVFDHAAARPWSEDEFHRVLATLRGLPKLKETIESERLEIATDTMHVHIRGVSPITTYCHREAIEPTAGHVFFQRVYAKDEALPQEFADMNITSQVFEDRPLAFEANEAFEGWEATYKRYTLAKRFVYESKDVRYVAAITKTHAEPSTAMRTSGVTAARPLYTFHVEILAANRLEETQIFAHCLPVMQALLNTSFLMTKNQTEEVLHGYETSILAALMPSAPKRFFLAPKPITLERMNLLDPVKNYGVTSILSGYAVTDKADGERMLMYIHTDGIAYLLNNTFEVRSTGMRVRASKLHKTLIDGEFVTMDKRRDGRSRNLFAAFDIYVFNGESTIQKPLLPDRMDVLNNAMAPEMWEALGDDAAVVELSVKTHHPAEGTGILEKCATLLSGATKLPYDIDGLIFTPRDVPVFGYYANRPSEVSKNMAWTRVLKWKPAEQNTIDFYVEYGQDVIDRATRTTYRQLKLHTGYHANQWEPITVMHGLRIRYDKVYAKHYYDKIKKEGEIYRFHPFKPVSHYEHGVDVALVRVVNGRVLASNGDEIPNKSIVEFTYAPNTARQQAVPISRRWRPLRVREDKTRLLQSGETSKTANDLSVAMSIWRSIHAPVTTDMIMGVRRALNSDAPDDLEERRLGVDDTYYARDIHPKHMLSKDMLYFHTHGVKKRLYQRSKRREALLELACGMAGDLPRWRDGGYHFVLGVDSVRDNITNPSNGSYAQMLRQKRSITLMEEGVERTLYPDHVFVVGDCAYSLHDGEAANTLDEESRKVLQCLYRPNGGLPAPYLKYLAGRAARGFDVVSCMFAIHYFFESTDTLNGFLNNVAANLRPGGIFIATFMDGASVDRLLEGKERGEAVEGRKLDGTVPVWAIVKDYDVLGATLEDGLSKRVGVYLENTRKVIPEYLVHNDVLVEAARAYGLVLSDTALFSRTFHELIAEIPAAPEDRKHLNEALLRLQDDPIQTQFSFLNRWVVFTKN